MTSGTRELPLNDDYGELPLNDGGSSSDSEGSVSLGGGESSSDIEDEIARRPRPPPRRMLSAPVGPGTPPMPIADKKSPTKYPNTPLPSAAKRRETAASLISKFELASGSSADRGPGAPPVRRNSAGGTPRRNHSTSTLRSSSTHGPTGTLRRIGSLNQPSNSSRLLGHLGRPRRAMPKQKSKSTTVLSVNIRPEKTVQLPARGRTRDGERPRPTPQRHASTGSLAGAIKAAKKSMHDGRSRSPSGPRPRVPTRSNSTSKTPSRSRDGDRPGLDRRGSTGNLARSGRSPHRGGRSPHRLRRKGSTKNVLKPDADGKPVLQSILRRGRFSRIDPNKRANLGGSRSPSFRGSLHRRRRISFDLPDEGSVGDSYATEESMQFGDWGLPDACEDDGHSFHESMHASMAESFHESMHSNKGWGGGDCFLDSDEEEDEDDLSPSRMGAMAAMGNMSLGQLNDYEEVTTFRDVRRGGQSSPPPEDSYYDDDYDDDYECEEGMMPLREEDRGSAYLDSDQSLSSLDDKIQSPLQQKVRAIDELGGASTVDSLHFSGLDDADEDMNGDNAHSDRKDDSLSTEGSSVSPTGVLDFRKIVDEESLKGKKGKCMLPQESCTMALKA